MMVFNPLYYVLFLIALFLVGLFQYIILFLIFYRVIELISFSMKFKNEKSLLLKEILFSFIYIITNILLIKVCKDFLKFETYDFSMFSGINIAKSFLTNTTILIGNAFKTYCFLHFLIYINLKLKKYTNFTKVIKEK